ncbi:MAG: UDP-glucose 4-epimerase GalE [Desulfohalobiaceae bacterium]|nr:UDP-glucose 4-epimerase GalE [Desulfohalobiaceae bacterium]
MSPAPHILVTGGAGYIGSHTVLALNEAGYRVVVYDNLSTGHAEAVLPPATLVVGDLDDREKLDRLFAEGRFSDIIHFAASIVVPESVSRPLQYYHNNTVKTAGLIQTALKHQVPRFIFSSTAAVYGMPEHLPVPESAPLKPINPYGRSKLMSEWILQDVSLAHPGFRQIILRYFNVAGADPQGRIGQSTPRATHLIKAACRTVLGQQDTLEIFGTDYPTPDGTGIRDYIHVTDLARAHVLALEYLRAGADPDIFNCGYGHGYSVQEIIAAVQNVSGRPLPTRKSPRRAGDPAQLVADPGKLRRTVHWQPQFDDIEKIVESAYQWERRRPY